MGGFPSGQREQTVNLSSMTSVVRIHHLPPVVKSTPNGVLFFFCVEKSSYFSKIRFSEKVAVKRGKKGKAGANKGKDKGIKTGRF